MKSDYCDEAYDRIISSSVSDDELFSQIKQIGYNKDDEKKEISIGYGAVSYTHLTLPTKRIV